MSSSKASKGNSPARSKKALAVAVQQQQKQKQQKQKQKHLEQEQGSAVPVASASEVVVTTQVTTMTTTTRLQVQLDAGWFLVAGWERKGGKRVASGGTGRGVGASEGGKLTPTSSLFQQATPRPTEMAGYRWA